MENSTRIKGMSLLLKKLPKEYHHWYLFGTILKLNYEKVFDYENKFQEVYCIDMILTDREYKYKIKVELMDVMGDVSFNITNGFFSGWTIEDKLDDYIKNGYAIERCFLITSYEQDISFEFWCESISVELLDR